MNFLKVNGKPSKFLYGILPLRVRVCLSIPSGLRPVEPTVPAIHPASKLAGILAKGVKINTLVLLAVTAVLVITGCSGNSNSTPTTETEDVFENFVPVVSATGKVVPKTWATLSVPSAGIVEDFLVEENDIVKKNKVLLTLSGSERMQAAVTAAQLEMISAEQALEDLLQNASLYVAEAEQALANARDQVRLAENRFNDLTTPNHPSNVKEAYALLVLAQDQLDKAKTNFNRFKNRSQDDVKRAAAQAALSAAQDAYDRAVRDYNWQTGTAGEIPIAVSEADLAYAQAALESARNYLDEIGDGPHPDTLALAQGRVDHAQAQLAVAQAALDDLHLTAPFAGTVSQIFVRQSEWVNPGQPVIVLGDVSNLQVETTDLSEIDVTQIQVGNKATVTFDALPDVVAVGTVDKIAAKSSPGSGVNYTVIITLDEIPEGLFWDMTAFIDIEVNAEE